MSSLIVEVCEIQRVEKHENADKLQVAHVKGWQVVTAMGQVSVGDNVVYVPPDCILGEELAAKWGVTNYLKQLAVDNGIRPTGGRVSVARLRGVHSFGFIVPVENGDWPIGHDVAEHFGIKKWEPPVESQEGDAAADVPAFHKYTDIENIRNFPATIQEGETVIFTEKIHGKNCRVGLIRATAEDGSQEFQYMAGSHGVRRKEIDSKGKRSEFWNAMTDGVKNLLQYLSAGTQNVVLFGEIYGSGVQDLHYGLSNGNRAFRVFDIAIDGRYIGYDDKEDLLTKYEIPMVPILYRGPFSTAVMAEHTSGPSTIIGDPSKCQFAGREGIVITPVTERYDQFVGRVILKSISPDYQMRKGGTEAR